MKKLIIAVVTKKASVAPESIIDTRRLFLMSGMLLQIEMNSDSQAAQPQGIKCGQHHLSVYVMGK